MQEYVSRQCHIIRNDDIITIFVLKGSLEENPSFLIGSFFVRICHSGRLRGNGQKPCIFGFLKRQTQ